MGCYSTQCILKSAWTVRKERFLKNWNFRDTQIIMPSTEIIRVRHCIQITIELMTKSVSLKPKGLKLEKLDCIST